MLRLTLSSSNPIPPYNSAPMSMYAAMSCSSTSLKAWPPAPSLSLWTNLGTKFSSQLWAAREAMENPQAKLPPSPEKETSSS